MKGHSPSPWREGVPDVRTATIKIRDSQGTEIVKVRRMEDGRLVSAAPGMLAELEAVAGELEAKHRLTKEQAARLRSLRKVIAKAHGYTALSRALPPGQEART